MKYNRIKHKSNEARTRENILRTTNQNTKVTYVYIFVYSG